MTEESPKKPGARRSAGDRVIAHLTIYPAERAQHSSQADLSALAGYAKALLRSAPQALRKQYVVLANMKDDRPRSYVEDDILVRECWRKGRLSYAREIWRNVNRDPDVALVHFQHEFNEFGGALTLPLNLLLVAGLRFLARRKVAVTLHEVLSLGLIDSEFLHHTGVQYPAPLVRLVLRLYYFTLTRLASHVVVQHQHFARVLQSEYRAPSRISIVKIGTEALAPTPTSAARQALAIDTNRPVLLFFGTLDWRKGLDTLVDAFSRLPSGSATLLVAGGQPRRIQHTDTYRDWWGRLRSRIDAMENVRLLGFVEDARLADLFGAADLVVLPYIVPQRVSAVFNQAASYGRAMIVSEAFADQAHPSMVFTAGAEGLAAKLAWALGGRLDELREYSLRFREDNGWGQSATAMARLHDSLIVGRASG